MKMDDEEFNKIYREIPTVNCLGLCTDSCSSVGLTEKEQARIKEKYGVELENRYYLNKCPMLKKGRCTIYEDRPAVCRMWGVEETMVCPWGCQPTFILKHEKGHRILWRLM